MYTKLSLSLGAKTNTPSGAIETQTVFDGIRAGRWRKPVEAYRDAEKRHAPNAKDIKSSLPAVTFAGRFAPTREAGNIREYTGLLCIDVDKTGAERAAQIESEAKNDPYCCGACVSAGGAGNKLLYRTAEGPDRHKVNWENAANHVEKTFGVKVDRSCIDLARLCFVSFDPSAWYNPDARPLPIANVAHATGTIVAAKDSAGTVDDLDHLRPTVEAVTIEGVKEPLSRIDPDCAYNEWLEVAMALRHQFPFEPEASQAYQLFDEWSATGEKYKDADDTADKWSNLKPNPKGRAPVTIRSLLRKAQEAGWVPKTTPDQSRIFYDNRSDRYLIPDKGGNYRSYKESHARQVLTAEHPLETKDQIAERLFRIRHEAAIDLVMNVSGMPRGLHTVNGVQILVPVGPTLITPSKGSWPTFRTLWSRMLGAEQLEWFLFWLASTLQSLYRYHWQPAQVMALIGPTGSAKSLTQKLITALLGGREARAMQVVTGATAFNQDWGEATHLVIEDEFAENSMAVRACVKENVKAVAVNEWHRIHPKGRNAVTVRPFWRMTISCNPTVESLAVLPILTEDVRNKISLLTTFRFEMPMPATTLEEKRLLWATLECEMPALVFDLLNLKDVPEHLRDSEGRFTVRAFHHPDALRQLDRLTHEGQLLQAILDAINDDGQQVFLGRARELLALMQVCGRESHQTERSLGKNLSTLAQTHPDRVRVVQVSDSHGNKYEINAITSDLLL